MIRDTGENAWWRPENDNFEFYGPTRLRVALAESRNLVSVRLLQAIGIPYALDYVQRFGFDPTQLPHALSLALGSGVVTPLQLTDAYAVFANGGSRVSPFFIDKVLDQHNKVLYEAPKPVLTQVITPQNAYLMTQAMKSVIQSGTAKAALSLNRPDLAGKTGTTNNQVDAWFAGFNSNLLAVVWVGYDSSEISLHAYGAEVALPIWISFMKNALVNQPIATMAQPADIVTARVNAKTGMLASGPDKNAIFEVFDKNAMPLAATATPTPSQPGEPMNAGSSGQPGGGDAAANDIF